MRVEVTKSFEKDVLRISDKKVSVDLSQVLEMMENCSSLSEISHLKKIKGFKNYYRIRIGSHRLGLKLDNDTLILIRFLNRKDIYKYFP